MKENNELREVTINEWIWIVFVILSLLNIYGDELEKSSLLFLWEGINKMII